MPIIVNVTILNGMDVIGEIVGQVFIEINKIQIISFLVLLNSLNGILRIRLVIFLNYHLIIRQDYGHGLVISLFP